MSESENSQSEQQPKKASPASKRPALAIYRPPGTRNSTEKATPETNGVSSPPPPAKQQQQVSGKESPEKKLDKKRDNNNKNNINKNKENNKKENGIINHKPKKEENNNNSNNATQPMIKHQKSKSRDGGLPKTPQSKPNQVNNPSKTINNKLANQVDRQEMFHQQRRSKSRDSIKIGQFGAQFQKTNTPPKSREAPAAFLRATPIMGRRGFDVGHHAAFSRPLNPEAAPFVPSALKQSVSPPTNGVLPESSLSPPVRTASAPINIGKASSVKLDWPEARQILIKLDLTSLMPFLDESGPSLQEQKTAEVAAHDLFQKIVEANSISTSNKQQARAVAAMLERCNDKDPIHEAIGAELWQYFECRDNLRVKHFRYWLSFVTFTAEVYSATGLEYDHETFVKVMLRNFDYMLHEPILESLRIEELEAIISALLSCGYDLERQCPDELAALKDSIRDAFVQAREPWARKMILLLVELAASGWRLPPQANEYYFEATNGA